MKSNYKTILAYLVMLTACGLAIFFFFRVKQLTNEVEALDSKNEFFSEYLMTKETVGGLDSLMLEGQYLQALEAYESLNKNYPEQFKSELKWRIALAKNLIKIIDSNHSEAKVMKVDSGATEMIAVQSTSPQQMRQYDSLNFALKKANLKVAHLRRQLEIKKTGEYLNFTTSKGKELHYVGAVENNKANGRGVAILISGSRYEGEWENNMRHGEGEFHWPDGQYYIGTYQDDKRHGLGTYYWPNGEKYIGQWRNDQRNGEGSFYGKDAEVVTGIWKKDKLVVVNKGG